MTAIDKTVSSDITLGQLLDGLAAAPKAPLVFVYDGRPVKAGYHVTEVKAAGAFSALDCGPTRKPGRRCSSSSGISTRAAGVTCRRGSSPRSSARSNRTGDSIPFLTCLRFGL